MSEILNPCVSCGACCGYFRVSFYWAEAEDGGATLPDGARELTKRGIERTRLWLYHKPAGLVTHPTASRLSGTLVNRLLGMGIPLSRAGGPDRPGIVRDISHALARHHVNIEELETEVASAAMSGLAFSSTRLTRAMA